MAEVIPIWYHQNFCSLERLMTFASVFKSDSFCGSHASWKSIPGPVGSRQDKKTSATPKHQLMLPTPSLSGDPTERKKSQGD